MLITMSTYVASDDVTEVTLEVSEAVSSSVTKIGAVYKIKLSGAIEHAGDVMYDLCANKLQEAGISVMPF